MFLQRSKIHLVLLCSLLIVGCASNAQKQHGVGQQVASVPVKDSDKPAFAKLESALQSGNYEDANQYLTALLKRYPNHPALLTNKALVFLNTGQAEDAITLLSRVTALAPSNAHHYVVLGEAYFTQNKFQASARAYKQALTYAPNSPHANYGLGVIYDLYLQDYEQAEGYYSAFLESADADTNAKDIKKVKIWLRLLDRKQSS